MTTHLGTETTYYTRPPRITIIGHPFPLRKILVSEAIRQNRGNITKIPNMQRRRPTPDAHSTPNERNRNGTDTKQLRRWGSDAGKINGPRT
jgi:hypothetical protein